MKEINRIKSMERFIKRFNDNPIYKPNKYFTTLLLLEFNKNHNRNKEVI